jgi:hypothetical protein
VIFPAHHDSLTLGQIAATLLNLQKLGVQRQEYYKPAPDGHGPLPCHHKSFYPPRICRGDSADRGSALGWELPLDAFHTNGSKGPFTSIDTKGGLQTFAASAKLEV